MKNLKANNERRADGVYFVRSASDQTARDEINYQMQNYNVDKSIARRVKKIMHRIFENDDAFRQGLINNEFNF